MKVTWNGKLREHKLYDTHSATSDALRTILKPYFKAACFCNDGVNAPFVFNSHCGHSEQPQAYGKTVVIPIGPITHQCTFWVSCAPILRERDDSPNVRLMVGSRFVGVLCPDTQTLWATGWTHYDEYRPMTQHIINYLAEQGLLKPLPITTKKKKSKKEKQVFTITIGGDPEFELVDNYEMVVRASEFVSEFEIEENFGGVGVDGSGDQVELRPSPGKPETVVENVKKLLEKFNNAYGEYYKLVTSSLKYPCGGHIHIGVEPLPHTTYYEKLSLILDEFIGRKTLELNGPARKPGNEYGYGRISDFRQQPYGMEYRTPPSAIWKNPKLTEITLKLTYNLAQVLANNLELEFSTPVDKGTLVAIGKISEEEASFYLEECAKPISNNECLLATWEIERPAPKPRITVTFRDSWCDGVKRIIRQELTKMEVASHINLTFYGLRSDHGDVYTFEIPGFKTVPHPRKGYGSTDFGFSKWFREGNASIHKIKAIISKIVVNLQNGEVVKPLPVVEEVVEECEPEAVENSPRLDFGDSTWPEILFPWSELRECGLDGRATREFSRLFIRGDWNIAPREE